MLRRSPLDFLFANLTGESVRKYAENRFIKDVWNYLKAYVPIFQKLFDTPHGIDKNLLLSCFGHISNLRVRLRYVIEEDFFKFVMRYGGLEYARLAVQSKLRSFFDDQLLYLPKMTTDVDLVTLDGVVVPQGKVLLEIDTSMRFLKLLDALEKPILDDFKGHLSVLHVQTHLPIFRIWSPDHIKLLRRSVMKVIEKDGRRNFHKWLKSIGIKDRVFLDFYYESFTFCPSMYTECISLDIREEDKLNVNALAQILMLDNWIVEDMKEIEQYISPFKWLGNILNLQFHVSNCIVPDEDLDEYHQVEWRNIPDTASCISQNLPVGVIKIPRDNTNWKRLMTIINEKFKTKSSDQLWYRVTPIPDDLIMRGIKCTIDTQNELGLQPCACVYDNFEKAYQREYLSFKHRYLRRMYIVIYCTPPLHEWHNLTWENDQPFALWNLKEEGIHVWKKLIRYTKSNNSTGPLQLNPNLEQTDFVYGNVSIHDKEDYIPCEGFHQLVIQSDHAETYFTKSMVGLIQIQY